MQQSDTWSSHLGARPFPTVPLMRRGARRRDSAIAENDNLGQVRAVVSNGGSTINH